MDVDAEFERIAADLVRQPVSHPWVGYGSAVFLEFGRLTPRQPRKGRTRHPDGEFSLRIEWSWRIESAFSIVTGSFCDNEHFEPVLKSLKGRRVESLSLFARLPEVHLRLSGDVHLLSFMTAEDGPEWALIDKRAGARVRSISVLAGQLVANA